MLELIGLDAGATRGGNHQFAYYGAWAAIF